MYKKDFKYFLRRYFLSAIDALLLVFSLLVYIEFIFPRDTFSTKESITNEPLWFVLIIGVWYVYAYVFDLYSVVNPGKLGLIIKKTSIVTLSTGLTYLLIPFFSPNFPQSRWPFFLFLAVLLVLFTLWRLLYVQIFKNPILVKRCVVIGAGWTAKELLKTLKDKERLYAGEGYRILALFDDDIQKVNKKIEGIRVIGTCTNLHVYARRLKLDEIIVSFPDKKVVSGDLFNELTKCELLGVKIVAASSVYESVAKKAMIKKKGEQFFLTFPYTSKHESKLYNVLNRIINIICAIIGLFIGVLMIPLIWILNLFFNRGPLFYVQERVGKGNASFHIYKFRTMIVDAEKISGPVWATSNDKRIPFIGKVLRKTRIDELPQFWNVLKGDMNLVGPRPERPIFVDLLSQSISFYNTRHLVKPGITGWAQVNYKYGASEEDALAKLQYDLFYIRNRTLFLDIRIILKTLEVVFRFKGT